MLPVERWREVFLILVDVPRLFDPTPEEFIITNPLTENRHGWRSAPVSADLARSLAQIKILAEVCKNWEAIAWEFEHQYLHSRLNSARRAWRGSGAGVARHWRGVGADIGAVGGLARSGGARFGKATQITLEGYVLYS